MARGFPWTTGACFRTRSAPTDISQTTPSRGARPGVCTTNPTGQGVQAKAALSEFYDTHMAESTIKITVHESYTAEAHESAHVMTLNTRLSNGVKTRVRGIFSYRTDEDGKITNLRGFWNMGVMEFEQPS